MNKVSLKTVSASGIKPKIDSPLAKYNSTGQLYCVLCNTPVKNEIYWTGHVNGKSHRDNVMVLKNKSKRPAFEESNHGESPALKKTKTHSLPVTFSTMMMPPPTSTSVPVSRAVQMKNQSPGSSSTMDYDDQEMADRISEEKQKLAIALSENIYCDDISEVQKRPSVPEDGAQDNEQTSAELPAGFFDDPKADAKARGIEFKDPEEAEWDKFVKVGLFVFNLQFYLTCHSVNTDVLKVIFYRKII